MKAKKFSAVVNFTIHCLRLPEDIQDPFQIEFKRGNTVGITEKKFVEGQNEVSYEKNFRCNVTLIKSDDPSSGEYKKKKIAFTVYRYRNNSKKVYGKFTINAADYLKMKTETIEVESPHSKKAYVIMSIGVTQSGAVSPMNDLDSQSEAIQLQTDHIDEWDVSDMVTPESRERIQNFFMKREAEKNEQRSRLSDFTRVAQQKEARNSRNRYQSRGSIDLLKIQTSLPTSISDVARQAETDINTPGDKALKHHMSHSPSFNSNYMENDMKTKLSTNDTENKEPVKLDTFLAKKNKKRGIPLPITSTEKPHSHHGHRSRRSHHSREGSNASLSSSHLSSNPDLNNDDEYDNSNINDSGQDSFNSPRSVSSVSREIAIEDKMSDIKSVLAKKWDQSPLDLSKYPISASVLVASLSHSHILEGSSKRSSLNDETIDEFIQLYKSSVLLSNLNSPVDKWYITIIFSATISKLRDQFNFDIKKVSYFNSSLSNVMIDQIYSILDFTFRPFEQVGRSLVEGNFEDIEISKSLNNSIQSFQKSLTLAKLGKPLVDFLTMTIVTYFDRYLVAVLLNSPDKCSFQNAAKWNTVITILYDSDVYRSHLKLFREAASVLMMSSILCEKPEMANEFCPDLDSKIVCKLMSIQKADEFLPIPNNVKKFMEFNNLTQSNCEPQIDLRDDRLSLDVIYSNAYDVSVWKNAKFSNENFDEFPFLKEFFSK